MKENIEYKTFEPTRDGTEFQIDDRLLENVTEENRKLLREMMSTGYYQDGIYIPYFLRKDLTINLELLELATILVVTASEAYFKDDITLNLRGLEHYYSLRGIQDVEEEKRIERTFILGYVSSVASEASNRDTLIVKYVM